MKKNLKLFVPLTKVDEVQRMVYGILTEEAVDKSGEILDYERSKPHFEAWSKSFEAVTKGKSKGNLRRMHQPHVAGHFTEMVFNDELKRIEVAAKVTDDVDWAKCQEGDYTGFSVGGEYVDTWDDEVLKALRFEAKPAEGSLVDNPCVYGATFTAVKVGGATELRKFKGAPAPDTPVEKDAQAVADQAKGVLDQVKALLAQAAVMEGDPATWTLRDLVTAMEALTGLKYEAEWRAAQEEIANAAKAGDMKKIAELLKVDLAPPADPRADPPAPTSDPAAPAAAEEKPKDEGAPATDPPASPAGPDVAETVKAAVTEANKTITDVLTKIADIPEAMAGLLTVVKGLASKADQDSALVKFEATTTELREAIQGIADRVQKVEDQPAPVGHPVGKTLGAAGSGRLNEQQGAAVTDLSKVLAAARGKVSEAAFKELAMWAASQAMP